jgi:hypothetical protein
VSDATWFECLATATLSLLGGFVLIVGRYVFVRIPERYGHDTRKMTEHYIDRAADRFFGHERDASTISLGHPVSGSYIGARG